MTVGHEPPGRLGGPALDGILAKIGRRVGLDVHGARLVKFTNNAVFRLADAGIVVRVAGSTTVRRRVFKVVEVARWLAEHDAPSVRLAPGFPQPIEVAGHLATLWELVPEIGPQPNGRDLADILLRLHALPPPAFDLPVWSPLNDVRQRLAEPEGLGREDLTFLLDRADAIEEQLHDLEYALPPGPIHGDATIGNLLAAPGKPVICDFDSTGIGPREWDLVPVAFGKLRFASAGDTHALLAGCYGFDVTRWPGFDVLRQVRELKLVTSVVPILRSNPAIREQWAYRLETFRRGDTAARWTTYGGA